LLALAKLRVGADLGSRAPQGVVTKHGLDHFGQQLQARVLHDVHGICVYLSEPKPQFIAVQVTPRVGKDAVAFQTALSDAIARGPSLNEHENIASQLFGAAFFQPTADGRFLLLMMAVEALIKPLIKSAAAIAYLDRFIKQIGESVLEQNERESLAGSLRWLRKASINQAGRRIANRLLGDKMYDGKVASSFSLRSIHLGVN
jgi:hypothetical protein